MPTGRPVLLVSFDEATKVALDAFCEMHDITASALIEVLVRQVVGPEANPRRVEAVMKRARVVKAARRNRRRS